MSKSALRRYEFSERLAEILGASRRDLRFRVTLLVSAGLVPPGPRGPGSPPATPDYAADLLIGVMAAPQQADTVEAIRCYRALRPTAAGEPTSPGVVVGTAGRRPGAPADLPLLGDRPCFGEALARLLDRAREPESRGALARHLFGIWLSRGFPVAAIQFAAWFDDRRSLLTQRYELPPGGRPPAWLDPGRGGVADPGLFHSVFLPVARLIDIGTLTAPDERRSAVLDLGPTLANIAQIAKLARTRRHRRPWEKFLSTAAVAEAATERLDARPSRLTEIGDFGSNPGNLRMLTFAPPELPPGAPLVVVLHGCTQTAASYDHGTGWTTLADRYGFAVVLPEQSGKNNPLRCFNWFRGEDNARDGGEALSIRQMVARMIADHGLDPARVYVTGLSAGGAMTSVMLATYPEVFAGGAILAAVPYRCAEGLQEAFECIFNGQVRSPAEWGDRVRAASGHAGPWPKVSIWHGDTDSTVNPVNAAEIVKQWTDVHGLGPTPTIETTVAGHRQRVWQSAAGEDVIEAYTIAGMTHGAPIDPQGIDGCGNPMPFIHDVGLSSTYHIARFWGLTDQRRQTAEERRTRPVEPARQSEILVEIEDRSPRRPDPAEEAPAARPEPNSGPRAPGGPTPRIDLQTILTRSFEAAGLLKGAREAPKGGGDAADQGPPLGIDVQAILTRSLEAAGLLKPGAAKPSGSNAPLGIDIPQILATSFEAAGLMRSGREAPPAATAAPGADPLTAAGWTGRGWQGLPAKPHAAAPSPTLFGYASSGIDCDVGGKVCAISRKFVLGERPRLRYRRKLDLKASTNMLTSAGFGVLIDGEPVDEVSVVGMDYAEPDWTERSDIDLGRFAGRTVSLTLEVTADANVCIEVFAKAWIDGIVVEEAVTV
jgi:feruloyl esterase